MKCKRRDTKAQYAVKIMNASFDASIEINSLKQCQGSEHIVCFIETMKDSHYNYIVFELLSGGELFKRIRDCNHFTESEARGYFRQLVAAVSYMHSKNIVHRDLKPENIMFVNNNGNDILKIVDFGFARKRSSESTVPCFTLDYAAPECLSKGKTTESGDLWSLGVILYTMCVGHTPFMPKTINKDDNELVYRSKLMDNIQKGSFDADSRYKHLSEPLKELIRGLLNIKEKTRFKLNDIQKNDWFVLEQSEVEDEIEEEIGEEEEEELLKDDEEINAEEVAENESDVEDTNETINGIVHSNVASGDEEEYEVSKLSKVNEITELTEVISDEEPEMEVDEAKCTSFERTDSVATEVFDPQEQDIGDFDMSAKTEEETKMENIDYLNDSRSKSSGIAGMSDPNDRSSNSIEEECEMDKLVVSVDNVIKNEIYHNADEEMEEQSEQPEEIISPNNLEEHVLVENLLEISVNNVETMHVKTDDYESFLDDEQKTTNDQEDVQLQQHPIIIKSVEVSPQRNEEESKLNESIEIPEGYVEVHESQLEDGYQLKEYPGTVDCFTPKGVASSAIVHSYLLGFHKTEVDCFYIFRGFDIYGKTPFDAFTLQDFSRKLVRKYKLRKRQLPRKNRDLREKARIAKELKASMKPQPIRRSTRRCTVTVKFEIKVQPKRGLKRRRDEIDLDVKALTVISDVPKKSEPKVIEKPIAKATLSQEKTKRKPRQPRQPRKKEVKQPAPVFIKEEPNTKNSVIMVKSTVSPKNSRFHRDCKIVVPGNVKKEPLSQRSTVKTISIKSRIMPPDNSLFEFQRISRGSVKTLGLDIYDFYEPQKKKQKIDQ